MIINETTNTHVETSHNTCEHHKRNPRDVAYAGCGCSSMYSLVKDANDIVDPDEQRQLDANTANDLQSGDNQLGLNDG